MISASLSTRLARWAAPAVAVLGLVLSVVAGVVAKRNLDETAADRLNALADLVAYGVSENAAHFTGITRALQASFLNLPRMERRDFGEFVEVLRTHAGAQYVQSFLYVERRRDPPSSVPGEERFIISYAEPLAGNEKVIGLDAKDNVAARAALESVRATGALSATAPFPLARSADGARAMAILAPLYVTTGEPRRFALKRGEFAGLVAVTVNLDKLLRPLADSLREQHVRLRIVADSDGLPESDAGVVLDSSGDPTDSTIRYTSSHEVKVAGALWRLSFYADDEIVSLPLRYSPVAAPGVVLTITFLLAALVHTLSRSRLRAQAYAEQATAELRHSEERFRDLAEMSYDWFWEQDAQYRFTIMSGGVAEKGRFSSEETLGKTRWELPILGVDEAGWQAHRAILERHEPFQDFTYQIRVGTGELRWYAVSGRPLFGPDGGFIGYRGTGRDVTDAKLAEAALRDSEQRYRRLMELSPDAVFVYQDRVVILANSAAARLFRAPSADDLIGRNVRSLIAPEDWSLTEVRIRQLETAEGDLAYVPVAERRFVTFDGEEIFVEAAGARVMVGDKAAILTVARDVTEQKSVRDAIRRQERLLSAVLEALPVGVWVTDANGKIISSNPAGPRIWAGAHHVGIEQYGGYKGWWADSGKEIQPEEWAAARAIRNGETSINEKVVIQCFDGSRKTILNSSVPLRDDKGELFGAIIVNQDITDLQQAEMEVRLLNETLEQRVRERTAELTASNRELEAFSYSVSHDLRAPLRAIDGFARIIEEDYAERLDEAGHGYLLRIRNASQRMAELIDDMLELARITRATIQRSEVDLSGLARAIAGALGEDAGRQVEFVIADDLKVHADPTLMRVMLENLFHNAWKFTGRTEAARIEFGAETRDGVRVFHVRDNGAGFDAAYADKLFQTFQRLHRPEEFAGTGIGLATVHRIIQRHGGRVWAEGAVGKGATFYFTLTRLHSGTLWPTHFMRLA